MSTPENNLREWIQPQLEELQMSVEELANKCGISRAILYAYFSDRHRPSGEIMVRICNALGRPLEEGLQQYTPKRVGRPTSA